MCDFNNLDTAQKAFYHAKLTECAEAFGGRNRFLQLLEAVRKTKPHPLSAANCAFRTPVGTVSWNKKIFQDKLTLLMQVRVGERERGNLLPASSDKNYKKVLNLVRTLNPLEFTITPKDPADGAGFSCRPFETVNAKTTRLDPLFDALFFCALETVKKVLAYKPEA